ncbi:lysozyme inhibitor LprI family protein [Microcoleus sp. A2-C5]|uniref:lysozyme inhibitor LprI family protein n=1 Tax=unclassified Microcoleus TaxID=2642155 RepID=UPI002FD69508
MKNSTFWATFTTSSLLLAAGFLLPSQASNNRLQIAQQPNCKSPQTTVDMTLCSTQEFKAADTKLNQLYQQILPIINSKQKQRLTTAQRTWVKFRDETCNYSAGHFEGGTLAPSVYISCKAKVTQQRVKDLEGYLEQANL